MVEKRELLPLGMICLMLIASALLWPQLPERVPTHWGPSGEADGWGPKSMNLLAFPLISLFIYAMFWLIPKIAVFRKNLEAFKDYYEDLKTLLIGFFLVFYAAVAVQMFQPFNMNYAVVPTVAMLFYFIGNILPHAKRNFFVGIRTPWTLANDEVWEKTHVLGGRLFKSAAILMLFSMLAIQYSIIIVLLAALGPSLFLVVYSFVKFKELGEKEEL